MKYFLILIVIFEVYAGRGKITYDDYTVYRVTPTTDKQIDALKQIEQSDSGYDFWQSPKAKNITVDIMVPPQQARQFKKLTSDLKLNTKVFIKNVQQLINASTPNDKPRSFGWTGYYRLSEIYSWMDALAQQYPGKVQVVVAGQSYKGRDIKGVKVSFQSGNKAVFIEGGMHAREWIAPATVTYMLNQLLTSTNATIQNVAKSYDWYFFPVVNPDGYEFTFNIDRLWRKTLKPYFLLCWGADPNRNWAYHWKSGGSSSFPCSSTYAGPSAFSEPETRALSNFIDSVNKNLIGYLAFHSYSQLILIPYGYTSAPVNNYNELMDIGTKAAASLSQKYGTQYKVGNIVDILYVASGSSIDWVKGTYDIPITYTYELRDQGQYGFLLPSSEIISTGQETLDSLVTIIQEAKKRGY